MDQFLTALGRPVHIINLDPAVPSPPYPCAVSITDLVTLDGVMGEHALGPNGAMLYCIEYLAANFDWLVERLDALLEGEEGDGYVIFDTPGQVELWTNHDSLKRMVERLSRMRYQVSWRRLLLWVAKTDVIQLVAVHLTDAHHITDASKFISVVLLALRAMMQLEMPHVNVLSKIDLLSRYGDLGEYTFRSSYVLSELTPSSIRSTLLYRVSRSVVSPHPAGRRAPGGQICRSEPGDGPAGRRFRSDQLRDAGCGGEFAVTFSRGLGSDKSTRRTDPRC